MITFSNRMFPTKAVRIWQGCSDEQRMTLVKLYLQKAGGYEGIRAEDRSRFAEGRFRPGVCGDGEEDGGRVSVRVSKAEKKEGGSVVEPPPFLPRLVQQGVFEA